MVYVYLSRSAFVGKYINSKCFIYLFIITHYVPINSKTDEDWYAIFVMLHGPKCAPLKNRFGLLVK